MSKVDLSAAGACPIPIDDYPEVLLAHGSGGKLTHRLIGEGQRDRVGWAVAGTDLDGNGFGEILTGGMGWTDPADESACTYRDEVGRLYRFDGASLP